MSTRRLAAVQRVRQLQEDVARGELARSNQRLQRATDEERHTWSRLDGSTLVGCVTAEEIIARWSLCQAGTLAADTQHQVTEHAASEVVLARDAWTVAARRVEALERLDERQRSEEAVELERKRGNELDDLVLARRVRDEAVAR